MVRLAILQRGVPCNGYRAVEYFNAINQKVVVPGEGQSVAVQVKPTLYAGLDALEHIIRSTRANNAVKIYQQFATNRLDPVLGSVCPCLKFLA